MFLLECQFSYFSSFCGQTLTCLFDINCNALVTFDRAIEHACRSIGEIYRYISTKRETARLHQSFAPLNHPIFSARALLRYPRWKSIYFMLLLAPVAALIWFIRTCLWLLNIRQRFTSYSSPLLAVLYLPPFTQHISPELTLLGHVANSTHQEFRCLFPFSSFLVLVLPLLSFISKTLKIFP